MTGKDITNLAKQFPIVAASSAVGILLLVFIYFRWMGFPELETRRAAVSREWVRIEANVFKNSVNLDSDLEFARQIKADIDNRLIRPQERARNYQYFYRMEMITGVRIERLQQHDPPPPPPPQRGDDGRLVAVPPPLFSNVRYTLTASGEHSNILHFLRAIEQGEHLCRLQQVGLTRSREPDSREVTVTMDFDLLGVP